MSNLFNISDLNGSDSSSHEGAAAGGDLYSRISSYAGKSGKFCQALDELFNSQAPHIDFMTAGNLSLHNILELLLHKYGPCLSLYLSTWAIKEAAARSIFDLKERKLIGKLCGVFDYRIESVDYKSFQLIKPLFANYALTKIHAKVILVEYADRQFTILTSANMSNNPRIEAGFISTGEITFNFHKRWMQEVFGGKQVY